MLLKLIDGGMSKEKVLTDKDRKDKIKNLRLHFTSIESNMASITQQAKNVKWDELNVKISQAKDYINGILKYIKDEEKKYIINPKSKKPIKPNPFRIVDNIES